MNNLWSGWIAPYLLESAEMGASGGAVPRLGAVAGELLLSIPDLTSRALST